MKNVIVSSKPDFSSLPKVTSVLAECEKELADSGRILLRYSGTEKKARVMVECESAEMCLKVVDRLAEVVKQEIGA